MRLYLAVCPSHQKLTTLEPVSSDFLVGFYFHLFVVVLFEVSLQFPGPSSKIVSFLSLHHSHQFVVSCQNVSVSNESAMMFTLLVVSVGLSIHLKCDQMVKNVANCVRPMQIKPVKCSSQKIEGETASKLQVKQLEMVVYQRKGTTYTHRELTLKNYS